MNHCSLRLALALLTCLQAPALFAQEWPRFRGENGSGVGRIGSLPGEFTKADYDWAVKLHGRGGLPGSSVSDEATVADPS